MENRTIFDSRRLYLVLASDNHEFVTTEQDLWLGPDLRPEDRDIGKV